MSDQSQGSEIKLADRLTLSDDFTPPGFDQWKETAEAALKGAPYEKKLVTRTYEGIDLQPIYTEADVKDLPASVPGAGSRVRGSDAAGYIDGAWEISQGIAATSANAFNDALTHDLKRGQTGITLLPDLASRRMMDSDSPNAAPKVARAGIPVSTLQDLKDALKDVDLTKYPLHIIAEYSPLEWLMMLDALLDESGIDKKKVSGSIDAEPLRFLAENGTLPVSLDDIYHRMALAVQYASDQMPGFKTISVCGLPYHNAGADAVSELAYVLASAVDYIEGLRKHGLSIDTIAKSMRFTFGVGPFYFMEVAKLRAARMLWTKIVESYGGSADAAQMTINACTSAYNQTVYDPYVNMLRTTTEAFSAIVAGVDSLTTNPFNAVLGGSDEFARRAARNTQIMLNEECRLDRCIDPAGGSYFVETLTRQLAEKAWKLFTDTDADGGMFKALVDGKPQTAIKAVAQKRKKDLGKRKSLLVGTNFSANIKEEKLNIETPDYDAILKERVATLKSHKANRGNASVEAIAKLAAALTDAPGTGLNDAQKIVELGKAAFLSGATLGETAAAKQRDGDAIQSEALECHRLAAMFENLRDAVEDYKVKNDSETGPKLFLATMGPLSQYKGRADFSQSFFEVGGFDVVYPTGFESPQDAAEAAIQSGAGVVVICSTDDTYPELVPAILKLIKEKKPGIITVLAGYPKDQIDAHKEAGIDEFIYMGADAYTILSGILTRLGVVS